MVEDLEDPRRTEPPFVLAERQMLEGWLEFHRTTLLLKCEGLDDAPQGPAGAHLAALAARPGPPHGRGRAQLVPPGAAGRARHAADLVRPGLDDSELVPLDDADWEHDLAAWRAECDGSRAAARPRRSTTPAPAGASRARCAGSTPT